MLHVAQLSFFSDPQHRRAEDLLQAWPTLVDVAEAAAGADVRVTVIQASAQAQTLLDRHGVDYCFMPLDGPAFPSLLGQLKVDVIHVQGLGFPQEVLTLAALWPRTPIVLQDRADRPPRLPWRRSAMRRSLRAASGLMFCQREQAEPWRRAGLLDAGAKLHELPGSTCRFQPLDRAMVRRATGMTGDPALLWVGHLDANKDPLTVLEGLRLALPDLPGAQLWCCFGSEPLGEAVRERMAREPALRGRVHLLGQRAHADIEVLMAAADFLVQGSHREATGYTVIEALACGLPPVVTDIPSFRALTGAGLAGRLWPVGDAQGLADALRHLAGEPQAALRAEARAQFERELSFAALGRRLRAAYEDAAR